MSIVKTITKTDDLFKIKYTHPQAADGSIRVEYRGPITIEQIDDRIAALESQIAEWEDTKAKCEEIN